jgi:hypothetical protein
MNKKFFAALVIMMGFTMGAMAQKADNDKISGKAEILQAMDVIGITALDFGRLSPGLAKTIDLENVATGGQVGEGTETTGVFSVSAAAGSNVQIQFTTLPSNLDEDGVGVALLPITAYTAGYYTADPFVTANGTTFTAGTGTQVATGNFPANVVATKNLIYVFLGATVTPGASQVSGTYAADVFLTATYN